MRLCLPTSALALLLLLPTSTRAADFSTEVLPILNTHCTQCHGGVKKSSGFSFTDPRSPFAPAKSGAIPVVPGEPGSSELIARITSSDPDERMPPEGDPLGPEQIALLQDWIARGAQWDRHWAFSPRSPGQTPAVQDMNWPANPIDHYVLEKLERAGIRPSPPADRPTLIRRVALDLTGLPPTPEQIEAFEDDQSPDAFEKVVDHFLASPHFGERWARHWLDQARYADSDGYEKDNARSDSWRWRQWVIDMINDDLAVDQFTIEQLAGDLIPDASPDQHLATAFHRQTLFNREGGVDPEEDRTKRVIDRATTIAAAWLGLTIQCAQCHDHPYDPITQREFYQFYAFFNNAEETTIPLPKHRESDIAKRQQAIEKAKAAARDELAVWMGKVRADLAYNAEHPLGIHPFKILEAKSTSGNALEVQADGSLLASGAIPDTDTYTLRLKPYRAGISGLKLEVMTDPQLPNNGPGTPITATSCSARSSSTATHSRAHTRITAKSISAPQTPWLPTKVRDGQSARRWASPTRRSLNSPSRSRATPRFPSSWCRTTAASTSSAASASRRSAVTSDPCRMRCAPSHQNRLPNSNSTSSPESTRSPVS